MLVMETSSTSRRGGRLVQPGQVVEAAMELLDAEGLAAVTFRRIGAELGVSHMTIYSCFASKDELLQALAAGTIDVPSIHPSADLAWHEALASAMHEIYSALSRRPAAAELLVTVRMEGAWTDAVREPLMNLLRHGGYDDAGARDGISMLFNYVLGGVLIDARRDRGGSADSFGRGLAYLIDGLRADAV